MFDIATRPPRPGARTTTPTLAWGYNNRGGLGLGHTARALQPLPAALPADVVDVQGGTEFTVALTRSGEVYAWGGNDFGQLGDGSTTTRLAAHRIAFPGHPAIQAIAVGKDHALALTRSGDVLAWGRNTHGQLGDGTLTSRPAPVLVASRVAAIGAGMATSVVVAGKEVRIWGRHGNQSAAGLELASARPLELPAGVSPVAVDAGGRHAVVLDSEGRVHGFGTRSGGKPVTALPRLDPKWGRVVSVSAGDNHTAALTDNGTVLTWGGNDYGQLGTGDHKARTEPFPISHRRLPGRVAQVVASGEGTLVRTEDGRLYGWGRNDFGQLPGVAAGDALRPAPVALPGGARAKAVYVGRHHVLVPIA